NLMRSQLADAPDNPDKSLRVAPWPQAGRHSGPETGNQAQPKTVAFGDPATVRTGGIWSLVSVLAVVLLWFLVSWLDLVPDVFWPSPMEVWSRFMLVLTDGYRGFTLAQHLWASICRIATGFTLGCLLGIPVGFSMGLSRIARGLFDPLIEFYRPIPPLA